MRREALRELDRIELEPAVRDILGRHPDGLKGIAIRQELNRHPAFEFNVPMKYMLPWLGVLVEGDVLVRERAGMRYRLTEYAREGGD